MNEYPPSSLPSLTHSHSTSSRRQTCDESVLSIYLPTYHLPIYIYVYISSTNFDNCGCQNPTTFFSCELDDDDDDSSAFLKTIVVIFSFDNPVAYLTNVSNNETDIV
jgi:hypothetical protein